MKVIMILITVNRLMLQLQWIVFCCGYSNCHLFAVTFNLLCCCCSCSEFN